MTDSHLGEITDEFAPGRDNVIAGMIIGLLMIGGGGFLLYLMTKGLVKSHADLPFWAEKGWCWFAVLGMSVLGGGFIIGGVYMIRYMRSLLTLQVHVGQHGFSVLENHVRRVYAWDDIQAVEETHLYERPPLLKGAAKYFLPKVMSRSFAVKHSDGETFKFNGTSIKQHIALADTIRSHIDPSQVPWEILEVHT
ncbi:MAG: hypothetical protein K8T91_06715 [Planctomycetes bacterium]|nr:hypothetical protein [Planctomycetota bacterium]